MVVSWFKMLLWNSITNMHLFLENWLRHLCLSCGIIVPGFNATSELEYENNWEVVYELLNLSHPSDGAEVVK